MANRRMFSLKIIDTDLFLDMPTSTQLLYFHLSLRADDDGFISSPKKIMKMVNCSDDDMKILVAKKFIIPFENGICVIRHWRIHNYIQKDRYIPTMYKYEKSMLETKDNVYEINLDTKCIQDVSKTDTQVRLGKVRLVEDSKDNIVHQDARDEPKKSKKKALTEEEKQQIENIWKLYPIKKGKAAAIKKIPKIIKEHGYEQLQRCIERYKQYVEHRQQTDFKELKYQNGSTFFNGTFEDYLDENWKEDRSGQNSNSEKPTENIEKETEGDRLYRLAKEKYGEITPVDDNEYDF